MNAPTAALAKVEPRAELVRAEDLELGVPVERLIARVSKIKEVQRRVMQDGLHFGKIPGVDKPTLLKPGAELLGMTFQLDPQFSSAERWDGEHLEVVVTCTLYSIPTGSRVGSGIGSCSTKESKYAYRKGERKCPKCGQPAIIKGREQYGGGWLCWNKRGGCGAKFSDSDKSIEDQKTDRVANPDLPDQYNTVRKMACKRAHVAAILFACGASELFTQDVEDMPHAHEEPQQREQPREPRQEPRQQQPKGNGGNKRQSQQSSKAYEASEQRDFDNYNAMVKRIAEAKNSDELDALVPELALLRDESAITPDQYKNLREVYRSRATYLRNEAPAPVGASD